MTETQKYLSTEKSPVRNKPHRALYLPCENPPGISYFLKKSGILIDCSFTVLDGVLG